MNRAVAYALLALAPAALRGQQPATDSIAVAGGTGIYVWLGGSVVSRAHPVNGVVAHRVERRSGAGAAWQPVADAAAVTDAATFFGRFDPATQDAIRHALHATTDAQAWNYIVQHPLADSLPLLLGHETARLALGLYVLDRNVRPGERWQYRVSRLDAAGRASAPIVSNVVTFPGAAIPDSARALRVEPGETRALVWWVLRHASRTRWLEVWRRQGTTGRFALLDSVATFLRVGDSLQATYRDTTLAAGGIYQYYAVPRDFFFNGGAASDTITAYAVNAVRLMAPDSIAAAGDDSTGIVLRWQFGTPGLARSFRVYRSSRQDSGWYPLVEIPGAERRFVDERVVPMRTYYYRLTTLGLKGDESPPTAAVFAHFTSRLPPEPPGDVQVDTARGGLRVRWTANTEPDLRGYYVFRTDLPVDSAVDTSMVDLVSPLVPAADTSWVDSTAQRVAGRQWTYALRAVNTSNLESRFSAPAAAPADLTLSPLPAPPVPTGLEAAATGGRVRVTWDDMAGIEPTVNGYVLSRRRLGVRDTASTVVATLDRGANAWWDSTAAAGASYSYSVRSRSFAGPLSAPSSPATVQVGRATPPQPAAPTAAAAPEGIQLAWGTVSGLTARVRIYRYERGTAPRVLTEVAADPPGYLDRTARAGVRYYYYLTFVVDGVEGARTEELSARR
jgi:fibronectin type 3 domain-containing protein